MSDSLIADVIYKGNKLKFKINNPDDVIQKTLIKGSFYEIEELEYLKTIIPPHSKVLDIGANIGNHTIFFSCIARCAEVIPFEANPEAIDLLKKSIELNNISNINTEYLGCALGGSNGYVKFLNVQLNNIGSQEFKFSHIEGEIKCFPVDSFNFKDLDFIKIDVEGMEIEVLHGMERTIKETKSILYVEVKKGNLPEFYELMRMYSYRIEKTFQRYRGVFNFLAIPVY